MKTVWILNHYAQEPGESGGRRHYSLGRHLLKHGWRSVILAASTELNTGRQRLSKHEGTRIEVFDEVQFLWVRTPRYSGNGYGRVANMIAYCCRVYLPQTTRALPRPDVVIGSSAHPFAAIIGLRLARRHRVPFIFEVRDFWPLTLIEFGRISEHGLPARIMRWIEQRLFRHAERVITLMPHAREYIVPFGVPPDRIVNLPNGVELDEAPMPATMHGCFTLMYFGAHGQANGLRSLLLAMKVLSERGHGDSIRLRMIGSGPLKESLVEQSRQLGLGNVSFESPVPLRQLREFASHADAFVITVRDLPRLYRFGISPNKLFEYLAAARPVIIATGAANNPVAEAGAGVTVAPDNPEALAEAIISVAAMPITERNRLGAAGRAFVEGNHSYAVLAKRLAMVLDEVLCR